MPINYTEGNVFERLLDLISADVFLLYQYTLILVRKLQIFAELKMERILFLELNCKCYEKSS